MFTQQPNHLMTHLSEPIPVIKQRMTVLAVSADTSQCKMRFLSPRFPTSTSPSPPPMNPLLKTDDIYIPAFKPSLMHPGIDSKNWKSITGVTVEVSFTVEGSYGPVICLFSHQMVFFSSFYLPFSFFILFVFIVAQFVCKLFTVLDIKSFWRKQA